MPQFFHKFGRSDVYINTIKAYPEVKLTIYSGSVFYNNAPNISGSLTSSLNLLSSGGISLYELNVDRSEAGTNPPAGARNFGPNNVENNNLIRPWVSKDGTRMAFRTTSKGGFGAMNAGEIIYSSYPLSASVTPNYYSSTTPRSTAATFSKTSGTGIAVSAQAAVTRILALKNTINYYNYINPHFAYSNSDRDFDSIDLGLVSIPSIFYGSSIKKGTIDLRFYYAGALLGRAQDTAKNGVLYETTGARAGSPIGIALYNEGMLILTGAYAMDNDASAREDYKGNNTVDYPRWVYFAQPVTGNEGADLADGITKTSYTAKMSGTTTVQTVTMFATLPKGQLNHSNNPSYVQFSARNHVKTGSTAYLQDRKRVIKNIVSSSYNDPTGSFEKTTYISKIGIYDENENLIAIAKPATPVKKTAERDFTFKLKLDI